MKDELWTSNTSLPKNEARPLNFETNPPFPTTPQGWQQPSVGSRIRVQNYGLHAREVVAVHPDGSFDLKSEVRAYTNPEGKPETVPAGQPWHAVAIKLAEPGKE